MVSFVLPATVSAQSAIVGVVKDNTGAVLPGVTVEAASDVLIEKVKTALTDGRGQYRIIDLRPGLNPRPSETRAVDRCASADLHIVVDPHMAAMDDFLMTPLGETEAEAVATNHRAAVNNDTRADDGPFAQDGVGMGKATLRDVGLILRASRQNHAAFGETLFLAPEFSGSGMVRMTVAVRCHRGARSCDGDGCCSADVPPR